jgi:hypothetical protein
MNFMKKLFSLGVFVMLFALACNAQDAKLKFESVISDFGSVQEDGGVVTTTFEFTNDGNAPLVINGVSASCGCATPEWTREPVPAKGKGFVKVSYNPKGRPGRFTKSVTVKSNASDQPVVLTITGDVVGTKR